MVLWEYLIIFLVYGAKYSIIKHLLGLYLYMELYILSFKK